MSAAIFLTRVASCERRATCAEREKLESVRADRLKLFGAPNDLFFYGSGVAGFDVLNCAAAFTDDMMMVRLLRDQFVVGMLMFKINLPNDTCLGQVLKSSVDGGLVNVLPLLAFEFALDFRNAQSARIGGQNPEKGNAPRSCFVASVAQ
jgi:hypothetical protein